MAVPRMTGLKKPRKVSSAEKIAPIFDSKTKKATPMQAMTAPLYHFLSESFEFIAITDPSVRAAGAAVTQLFLL